VTPKRAPLSPAQGKPASRAGAAAGSRAGLEGLPAALADIVCWTVFYLQRCDDQDIDDAVAEELRDVIASALGRLAPMERVAFLQHAAERASDSKIPDYQDFLLEVAELLGIE
jgi:hypothetical protein